MPPRDSHRTAIGPEDFDGQAVSEGLARRILRDLETRRLVPGQRLIETELALRFGVGRNAVREAIQRLAARGIVELNRNRSPAIRELTLQEVMEVLEVAEEMNGLLARSAARDFNRKLHGDAFRLLIREVGSKDAVQDAERFADIRRRFYRLLLETAANRELRRHFSAINMQVVYAQYHSASLQATRIDDYLSICRAVSGGKVANAEAAARRHVQRVREAVQQLAAAAG
jgi:DNA-binding GntR family transcriptional regulator